MPLHKGPKVYIEDYPTLIGRLGKILSAYGIHDTGQEGRPLPEQAFRQLALLHAAVWGHKMLAERDAVLSAEARAAVVVDSYRVGASRFSELEIVGEHVNDSLVLVLELAQKTTGRSGPFGVAAELMAAALALIAMLMADDPEGQPAMDSEQLTGLSDGDELFDQARDLTRSALQSLDAVKP
jgi:hypothetical protein